MRHALCLAMLLFPLTLSATVPPRSNVIDLPKGSEFSLVRPTTIRAGIPFAELGGSDTHSCFFGRVDKFPAKMAPPDFVAPLNDRKFKVDETFSLLSVDGFRQGNGYQAYTLRLRHAIRGERYVLYLEQMGAEVGFTSVATLLTDCGGAWKVE